jgi:hypothetical protein
MEVVITGFEFGAAAGAGGSVASAPAEAGAAGEAGAPLHAVNKSIKVNKIVMQVFFMWCLYRWYELYQ